MGWGLHFCLLHLKEIRGNHLLTLNHSLRDSKQDQERKKTQTNKKQLHGNSPVLEKSG